MDEREGRKKKLVSLNMVNKSMSKIVTLVKVCASRETFQEILASKFHCCDRFQLTSHKSQQTRTPHDNPGHPTTQLCRSGKRTLQILHHNGKEYPFPPSAKHLSHSLLSILTLDGTWKNNRKIFSRFNVIYY